MQIWVIPFWTERACCVQLNMCSFVLNTFLFISLNNLPGEDPEVMPCLEQQVPEKLIIEKVNTAHKKAHDQHARHVLA